MEIRYKPVQQFFIMKQAAYLMAEGVGVNGSYFFKVSFMIENNILIMSASGDTAAKHSGRIQYYFNLELWVNQEKTLSKKLTRSNQPELWANDGYTPIGSTKIALPVLNQLESVELVLNGSYTYNSGSGHIAPLPYSCKKRIPLSVEVIA